MRLEDIPPGDAVLFCTWSLNGFTCMTDPVTLIEAACVHEHAIRLGICAWHLAELGESVVTCNNCATGREPHLCAVTVTVREEVP